MNWLGDVPSTWNVLPGRRLFSQEREPARPGDLQLSSTQKYGVIPQALFMELEDQKVVLALSGTTNFQHVEQDDFVISLRSFQGGIERCGYVGCVSPAYTVLRPRTTLDPKYWSYLLKSNSYVAALQSVTAGIRDGKNISYEQFGAVGVPVPPLPDQVAIATALDSDTAKIDALVAEQERMIELLKEKRQAVISHAVTKGLNPNTPMKPSGIEWFGDVPAHWQVAQCGRFVDVLSGYPFPSDGFSDDHSTTRLLRGVNVSVGRLRWDDVTYWKRSADDGLDRFELSPADLVVGMDRPCISEGVRVARVETHDLPCLLLQRVARLRQRGALDLKFLQYLLGSQYFVAHFEPDTTGVSVPHISPEQIAHFVVPVPPLTEQHDICRHLDQVTRAIDSLAKEATSAIELLQERRSALISAAVTGQIDVRQLAPQESAT